MVVDAMTGQDAVNSAKAFNEALELSGFVVTKTRWRRESGVILSIKACNGKTRQVHWNLRKSPTVLRPFIQTELQEEYWEWEMFCRSSISCSITLTKKGQEMEEKFLKNKFDLEDFPDQLKEVKSWSIADIMEMIPGAPKDVDLAGSEKSMKRTEAIIHSMTSKERKNPKLLNYSRKQRVARGKAEQRFRMSTNSLSRTIR